MWRQPETLSSLSSIALNLIPVPQIQSPYSSECHQPFDHRREQLRSEISSFQRRVQNIAFQRGLYLQRSIYSSRSQQVSSSQSPRRTTNSQFSSIIGYADPQEQENPNRSEMPSQSFSISQSTNGGMVMRARRLSCSTIQALPTSALRIISNNGQIITHSPLRQREEQYP